ncbi:MAG: hypothetical protein ACPHID_04640 [Thermoplasmatota archaeon]
MKLLATTALLVLALAGCAGDDAAQEPMEPPSESTDDEPAPEPEVVYAWQEVLNETFTFTSNGLGQHHDETLQIPEGTRAVSAEIWMLNECPVGTYSEPAIEIDLAFSSEKILLFPNPNPTGTTEICPFVTPTEQLLHELELAVEIGEWRVESVGDCMCTSRVVIQVEIPE